MSLTFNVLIISSCRFGSFNNMSDKNITFRATRIPYVGPDVSSNTRSTHLKILVQPCKKA